MEERKVKQVIIVRKDLIKGENAVRRGKMIAQGAHASVGALLSLFKKEHNEGISYMDLTFSDDSYIGKWINGLFTKICLSVENDEELVTLYKRIKSENPNIPCVLITDCGLTEFKGVPTNTCIGIGPYWADEIDVFTKDLKLL